MKKKNNGSFNVYGHYEYRDFNAVKDYIKNGFLDGKDIREYFYFSRNATTLNDCIRTVFQFICSNNRHRITGGYWYIVNECGDVIKYYPHGYTIVGFNDDFNFKNRIFKLSEFPSKTTFNVEDIYSDWIILSDRFVYNNLERESFFIYDIDKDNKIIYVSRCDHTSYYNSYINYVEQFAQRNIETPNNIILMQHNDNFYMCTWCGCKVAEIDKNTFKSIDKLQDIEEFFDYLHCRYYTTYV